MNTKKVKKQEPGLNDYATPPELQCLIRLIGMHGARCLDAALLNFVSAQASKVMAVLGANEAALNVFRTKFTENPTGPLDDILASVKDSQSLVEIGIVVGNALSLRKMLHRATGVAQTDSVPLIQSTLSLATESISHDEAGGARTPALMSLARSCGIEVGGLDPSLRSSLENLGTGEKQKSIWRLLPYAYAAAFANSESWKACNYISGADVMSGGEHVTMECISSLCVNLLGLEGGKEASVDFLRTSCSILFMMKGQESGRYSSFPIRAMFVLMEKFIDVSPVVDRHVLEKYMPYTILHAAYVDMSLSKQRYGDVAIDAKDAFCNQ